MLMYVCVCAWMDVYGRVCMDVCMCAQEETRRAGVSRAECMCVCMDVCMDVHGRVCGRVCGRAYAYGCVWMRMDVDVCMDVRICAHLLFVEFEFEQQRLVAQFCEELFAEIQPLDCMVCMGCGVVRCGMHGVWCGVLWCGVVWCSVV